MRVSARSPVSWSPGKKRKSENVRLTHIYLFFYKRLPCQYIDYGVAYEQDRVYIELYKICKS